MTIYKAPNYQEEYRLRALSNDVSQLTGRTRPLLTAFVSDRIIDKIELKPGSVVVDIGCGDGSFLQKAAESGVDRHRGRLIGILPTEEEVRALTQHLAGAGKGFISVEVGRLDSVGLSDGLADVVVSNGVFILLSDREAVIKALLEIGRIAKPGGCVFIGELPDSDEMAGRTYGNSISAWLLWVLRNRGVMAFIASCRQVLRALLTDEPFIVSTKKVFHCDPQDFKDLLEAHGFSVLEHYRHKEIDANGHIHESPTRWNFLARKAAA
jgi:SAM-dependent methyltransferase